MIELNGISYYTAREFADEVGVTKTYICRLVRNEILPSFNTGHQYLIPVEALDVWQKLPHKTKRMK